MTGASGNGRRRPMLDMKVTQLTVDPLTNMPIVILKDCASEKEAVPIWIGISEASAIATELEKIALERPMTHDLLKNIIGEVGVRVDRVEVARLQGRHLLRDHLSARHRRQARFSVDSRPSDALALALRCGARICVARKVIDQANRMDKRPDVAAADGEEPGILEALDDEDFGKWKM